MTERQINREGKPYAEVQRSLTKLSKVIDASAQPPYSLADRAGHQTWQHLSRYFGESKPDQNKSFTEISPQNAGNNVANVYITGEYIAMKLADKEQGATFQEQMTAWAGDERDTAEKFMSDEYGLVRDAVLEAAEFMHNGYAYSNQAYKDAWRTTSLKNRKKSFIVALGIADNMFRQIARGDESFEPTPINDHAEIEKLRMYNLDLGPKPTEVHTLWDKMMDDVSYIYDIRQNADVAKSVDFIRARREGEIWELLGDQATDQRVSELVNDEMQHILTPDAQDAYTTVARLVHENWVAVQLSNPLRISGSYDASGIGARKQIRAREVNQQSQGIVRSNLENDPSKIITTYMKQHKLASPDAVRETVATALGKPAEAVTDDDIFGELIIETDPRIGPFASLSAKDQGNNIVAIASTYESIRRRLLSTCKSPQDAADILAGIVRHGLVNEGGSYDGSNDLIEQLSAEQHAAWLANAFKRDGIAPDRQAQYKLYRNLAHMGMPGVTEGWQDEKHYDREAVLRSCAVLLLTYMNKCQDESIKIRVDDDVQAVLDNLGLTRITPQSIAK